MGLILGLATAGAAQAAETFGGTATVKTPTQSASRPITVHVERFLTEAERDKVVSVVKTNDTPATVQALAAMPDVGYIELGNQRTPVKYAYFRSTGAGRMVTVVTAKPILHLGGNLPNAKPKEGFDLGLALLILDANDTGTGELAPAVKLKVNDSGAIETQDYGSEVVRINGITKKQ